MSSHDGKTELLVEVPMDDIRVSPVWVETHMSFDATASKRLIPVSEKRNFTTRLPLVSLWCMKGESW